MTANAPTIFVQIASYRDPECQWTVKDMFEKARHPERVTVGICWQRDPEKDRDCFIVPSPRPAQTKAIFALPQESEGVCWARSRTQALFEDQDYVLMIDSHMRFIPDWDLELVAELKRCASVKSFLSTYPPSYTPPNNLEANPRPIVMRAKEFNEQGDIRFEGEVLVSVPERPLRGAFLAAGLLFAPGKFVREIPYDPFMYFNQEEITLAARAFTHGWDVYAPTKAFVYHYYNDKVDETRALHWRDRQDWLQFQTVSRQRFEYLLADKLPQDVKALQDIELYGLGSARSLRDFEEFSGIDFRNKISSEKARRAGFIEGLERYRHPPAPPARFPQKNDLLAPIALKDMRGNMRSTGDYGGRPAILCVLPFAFDAYAREFIAMMQAGWPAAAPRLAVVAPVALAQAPAFIARNGIATDLLVDEERLLGRLFGYGERLHDTPLSIALDARQLVRGLYDNRNAANHFSDLRRTAAMLSEPEAVS